MGNGSIGSRPRFSIYDFTERSTIWSRGWWFWLRNLSVRLFFNFRGRSVFKEEGGLIGRLDSRRVLSDGWDWTMTWGSRSHVGCSCGWRLGVFTKDREAIFVLSREHPNIARHFTFTWNLLILLVSDGRMRLITKRRKSKNKRELEKF